MKKIVALLLIVCSCLPTFAAKNEEAKPVKITTTFLVMIPSTKAEKQLMKELGKQEGIKKMTSDFSSQTIEITFTSDKNTVGNLLRVIRGMGYTATALETGCFGSKEGCMNALKPENTMP